MDFVTECICDLNRITNLLNKIELDIEYLKNPDAKLDDKKTADIICNSILAGHYMINVHVIEFVLNSVNNNEVMRKYLIEQYNEYIIPPVSALNVKHYWKENIDKLCGKNLNDSPDLYIMIVRIFGEYCIERTWEKILMEWLGCNKGWQTITIDSIWHILHAPIH